MGKSGADLLRDPLRNRGLSFGLEERKQRRIGGLLPARVLPLKVRSALLCEQLASRGSDLQRYELLTEVQNTDEDLFYHVLISQPSKMVPYVYTPTVGEACINFSRLFVRPRGMFVTLNDLGNVPAVLDNWPEDDVRVIVVTDGERILGLGDRGANGMGIPIGKLALYTALAGVPPAQTLPVTLDVGTNRKELLEDPYYIGLQRERCRTEQYDALVEEFVTSAVRKWPRVLVQFEDFGITNALRLLEKYRNRVCCFNDDVQGTGSVTLAGLLAAARMRQQSIAELKVLFYGAGSAAVGIAHMIASTMVDAGLKREEAMQRIWFVDSRGLVVKSRIPEPLAEHKLEFAHEGPFLKSLPEIVKFLKPNAIVGVSGDAPNVFCETTLHNMMEYDSRPIVFALSNPTSKSECTAEFAYRTTNGAAIFASGSPFDPVPLGERTLVPGQANNAYIFPGVGLGVMVSGATRVTDEMFIEAARALSVLANESEFASGCLFPNLDRIREVSAAIAKTTCEVAAKQGLSTAPAPANGDWLPLVHAAMYTPGDAGASSHMAAAL